MSTPGDQSKGPTENIIRGPQCIKLHCHLCGLNFMVYSNADGTWKPKQPCMHIAIEGVFAVEARKT